ncbi:MepB family protein [Myroides sp. LJL119]
MINSTTDFLIKNRGLNKDTIITNLKNSIYKNDYNACCFELQNLRVIFRNAKLTPTKAGLFVAIWKKDSSLKNTPFHEQDNFDLLVIRCHQDNNLGYFVFTKQDLSNLCIIQNKSNKGKMGIRLYPSWCINLNNQAKKTQLDHSQFFFEE